jgi:hypothetical protein
LVGEVRMALLTKWKLLPEEERTAQELFDRLLYIESELADFYISWNKTKKLLQERVEIRNILCKLGYDIVH